MCALLCVGGLQTVVSKSAVAAQAEVQAHVGIVVDAFATCSRQEKQSRGAGRGTCACVHSCGPASATDSGLEKRSGIACRGACVHCCGWAGCR